MLRLELWQALPRRARVGGRMTSLEWNAGGTSIEDLAEKFPDKIVKVPVEIQEGITDAQARPLPYPTLFCPVIHQHRVASLGVRRFLHRSARRMPALV